MTYFRHAERHIQFGVEQRVKAILDDCGWLPGSPAVPFGESAVDLVFKRLDDRELRTVKGNMVAVVFGDRSTDKELELGGSLSEFSTLFWLNVVAERDAVALAIASDLIDGLSGRNPAFSRFLPVQDYTSTVPVFMPNWRAEFTEIVRQRPQVTDWRKAWQVVEVVLAIESVEG